MEKSKFTRSPDVYQGNIILILYYDEQNNKIITIFFFFNDFKHF